MQVLIDNLDGQGPVDYGSAVITAGPLTITRQSDAWTLCTATLDPTGSGLSVPVMGARVLVNSNAGVSLFKGYVTRVPLPHAAVQTSTGEAQLVQVEAVEDAWLVGTPTVVSLQPATSVTHTVSLESSAVSLKALPADELNLLAADVTLSGSMEATTYATELFAGDGTTSAFTLLETPYRASGTETLLADSFDASQFRAQAWTLVDTGQHIGFGSGGLLVSGGNGFDGQTTMVATTRVEMGGTLVAELSSVTLQAGSDGVLLGMYSNIVTMPNCVAGFRVKGTAGAKTIVALVNGVESGTAFTFDPTHMYTLRLRLHCTEMQRVLSSYEAIVNGALQSFGGGLVSAPLQVVLEIQDLGLASSTVATVLYAGAIANAPARCVFGLVNSVNLLMTAGNCTLKQTGSAWVTSTLPSGATLVRREGTADEGADFALSGSALHFWPGRVPAPNETFTVLYRPGERAFARVQNATALTAAQTLGLPGSPVWMGAVHAPAARSTADCQAAAQALLAFAASPSTGVAGVCTLVNPQQVADVQPGDQLALPAVGGAAAVQVPVKRVVVKDEHAVPEVLRYDVEFAQTKNNGLSFTTTGTLATEVPLPVAVSATAILANLQNAQVVSATTTALQIDAGLIAPNGGGFEVRRRDGGWGTSGVDLVLRSPVRSFSVPRLAYQERFYVRMYDGSTPPLYSARSSVVVTHLPTS